MSGSTIVIVFINFVVMYAICYPYPSITGNIGMYTVVVG